MDDRQRFVIPRVVGWRTTVEGTVVSDVNRGEYQVLRDASALVWAVLAKGGSLAQAASALVDEYGIDPGPAQEDARAFAGELVRAGFLASETAPTSDEVG